jgi:hypothetical protein
MFYEIIERATRLRSSVTSLGEARNTRNSVSVTVLGIATSSADLKS